MSYTQMAKFAATRLRRFRSNKFKFTQMRLRPELHPDPSWGAYDSPLEGQNRSPIVFWGGRHSGTPHHFPPLPRLQRLDSWRLLLCIDTLPRQHYRPSNCYKSETNDSCEYYQAIPQRRPGVTRRKRYRQKEQKRKVVLVITHSAGAVRLLFIDIYGHDDKSRFFFSPRHLHDQSRLMLSNHAAVTLL